VITLPYNTNINPHLPQGHIGSGSVGAEERDQEQPGEIELLEPPKPPKIQITKRSFKPASKEMGFWEGLGSSMKHAGRDEVFIFDEETEKWVPTFLTPEQYDLQVKENLENWYLQQALGQAESIKDLEDLGLNINFGDPSKDTGAEAPDKEPGNWWDLFVPDGDVDGDADGDGGLADMSAMFGQIMPFAIIGIALIVIIMIMKR